MPRDATPACSPRAAAGSSRIFGSTNGTYLADQQLTRALPVELGVPVRIGKTVIELRP